MLIFDSKYMLYINNNIDDKINNNNNTLFVKYLLTKMLHLKNSKS